MHDELTRNMMLQIASQYDKLAEYADKLESRWPKGHGSNLEKSFLPARSHLGTCNPILQRRSVGSSPLAW